MSSLFGEFFGTMVLVIFGNGVVANVLLKKSKAEGAGWIVISSGWAFAVVLGVFCAIATGSSQADINPAVTLAKTLMGVYKVDMALLTMAAQLAGGIAGGVIVWLHFFPHWKETEDPGLKLAAFSTGPAIRDARANLLSEIIGTVLLIVPMFAIFSKPVGGLAPGFGPYLVGILVWGIGVSLGGTTGYAINPARDLGPRIAHAILPIAGKGGSDWSYAWIPVVGPAVGGAVAFVLAKAIQII